MINDYSKMSDFEINQAVAFLLGLDVKHYQDRSGDMVWFTVKNEDGNEYFDYIDYKDFCNNPNDAWPIIDENNITIINDNPSLRFAVSEVAAYFNGSNNIWSAHENGLRAAMIVFLKMQESKNAS